MKGTIQYILFAFVFFSCVNETNVPPASNRLTPVISEAKALQFAMDSSMKPDSQPLKHIEPVLAGVPSALPAHSNTQPYTNRVIIKAGSPQQHIPGDNGFLIPEELQITKRFNKAGLPELVMAKDAYFPANNPFSFSFFTRLQGLQHDDISSITQDKMGNIWVGTYGGGAVRYDGLNFSPFTEKEGLSQNSILSILADSNGDIWFGTRAEGAVRFDGTNFYYLSERDGLVNNRVEEIFEDSKGNMWFGTYNGVSKLDGENIINYTINHGLSASIVYKIIEDKNGVMWFGTRGGGITKFDGESFQHITTQTGLIDNYVVALKEDRNGNLWIGTDGGGLCKFDGAYFTYFGQDQGLKTDVATAIHEDRDGNIWIGTRDAGLIRFDLEKFTYYSEEQGLINSFITCILEDKSGKLWLGSYGGGIAQYRGNVFSHFNEKRGLKDGFVRSIFQDSKGELWFGTNREGVFKYNGEEFINYNTMQGLGYMRVGDILEDQDGNYWFGTTGGGVSKFDGETFVNITEEHGLGDDFILSMMQDHDGNFWFVTRNNGVTKFDGKTFFYFTEREGLSDNNARCILQDSEGKIWIGTRAGGVSVYDGDSFIHYNTEGGLIHNNILDILEDTRGNIWIATNGRGVSMFDGDYFTHFTEKEGLISNFVYSLLEDSSGNMWFGTRMGLSKLLIYPEGYSNNQHPQHKPNLSNTSYTILFKNYTQEDGFLGIGCNSRSILQDNEGVIWIGANDILTAYYPFNDIPDTIKPNIQITGVGLYNEKVLWNELFNAPDTSFFLANGLEVKNIYFDAMNPWYEVPQNLSLRHDNNFITFSFVGITSNFTSDIRYQHKLQGMVQNWSALTRNPVVSYGNLSPGKYTFTVKALNSEGYWSQELDYHFQIRYPWWRTWWAYLIYATILICSLFFFYQRQKQRAKLMEIKKKKELQLEQEVIIARRSAEFKQNFLANMSHEIRTPLTGILGMASMLRKIPLDNMAKEYIEALNQSGETLRETINMILDISKIEAGKLELKENVFSIEEVFNQSIKAFDTLVQDQVVIQSKIDPNLPKYLFADQQRISQIIKNFLSNAIKFTQKGTITLKASVESDLKITKDDSRFFVKIEVCDTGMGISQEEQKKLFTPFYQTTHSVNSSHEGTGLGLAICKELASLLGGQIGVESQQGVGSCFWFSFITQRGEYQQSSSLVNTRTDKQRNQSLNILLVEDKIVTQKVVNLMLNAMGHTVTLASNGQEAIDIYTPDIFDLIIMDIQMPVMDGITATKKLKSIHKTVPPIVGLSANAFEGDREKYMAKGLDEYITKPVKENDFKKILSKLGLMKSKDTLS